MPQRPNASSPTELSAALIERGRAGREVRLSADTAFRVGLWLRHIETLPTRNEVAMMICRRKEAERCAAPCYECAGRANKVVAAYGLRPDPS